MSGLTEAEVLAEIAAIEAGTSVVTCPDGWGYCGVVTFHTSNGWAFQVFNDCDSWDYFERINAPDGRELTFDDLWPESGLPAMRRLLDYEPGPESELRWGIAR